MYHKVLYEKIYIGNFDDIDGNMHPFSTGNYNW